MVQLTLAYLLEEAKRKTNRARNEPRSRRS